jgi:hypothetical protein
MGAVAFLLDVGQQHFKHRANVAYHSEIDRRAAADLFGSHPPAQSAHRHIELAVREIGAEHQEHVAIEHGVVTGREADQPRHANVKGVHRAANLLA